ncbi:MAG TPA: hypothetical protein VGQ59_07845 [Cyclobacteriaceae bacterium]|jgi:hypothetical protein|nr:hypothetical protein [Cyclobacteriaceae bacterium]
MQTTEELHEELRNKQATPKTREGLIKLYVKIVSKKYEYKFDPKRMILDVLPGKADLFKVSMVNHVYSLAKSREDYPQLLDIKEHRFINFLKFTPFTQQEIDAVFDAYESTQALLTRPENSPPPQWAYTINELYRFLRDATSEPLVLPLEEADGVPFAPDMLERLYQKEVKRTKRLRRDFERQEESMKINFLEPAYTID